MTKRSAWWKGILDVQAPYRWNVRRLKLGFTLDIGCGLGRNLQHLSGNGVGIDHNAHCVEIAKSFGLQAFTLEAFETSSYYRPALFDSLLLAHVLEHMVEKEAVSILRQYIHLLKPNGQVVFITPQELGFRSELTHIQFMDFDRLRNIAGNSGLVVVRQYSFPFPRRFGHFFKYNEFVCVCRLE